MRWSALEKTTFGEVYKSQGTFFKQHISVATESSSQYERTIK
jgi:hypothetical protein